MYTGPASKRGAAKQHAYEQIKKLILARAGSNVEFLGEEAIAAELGVSRTPVREAFLRLEAEHLLQLVPGRGAFIPMVTEAEVLAVIEVRELVEVFGGRKLATEAETQGEVIATIRETYAAQKAALKDGEEGVVQFIFLDLKFHREIIASAGNPVLLDIYERLRDRELRMDAQAHNKYPGRLDDALKEHLAILRALEQKDPGRVETAIRKHLANTSLALR